MHVIIPTLNIAYSYQLCETVYECESDEVWMQPSVWVQLHCMCTQSELCR